MIDPRTKKPKLIDPKESDRVFVDVTAYNSKNLLCPGRGSHSRSAAGHGQRDNPGCHQLCGGLSPRRTTKSVFFIAKPQKDGQLQALHIDIDQITMGDDLRRTTSSCPAIAWSFLAWRISRPTTEEANARAAKAGDPA